MDLKLPKEHPLPMTRRQFLGAGLIDAFGLLAMPSLLDFLIPRQTFAMTCESPVFGGMPFLLFDCVGGAALSGNFVVGKEGGPLDFLASYDQMGVPRSPKAGEPIDDQFGVPLYTNLSFLRKGLLSTLSDGARSRLRLSTICNSSQDDTGGNLLSPLLLVANSGTRGRYIETPLGTFNTLSGGNSQSPLKVSNLKPLRIMGADDIIQSLSFGKSIERLKVSQRRALASSLLKVSQEQLKHLEQMHLKEQFSKLTECGYLKNVDYAETPQGIDPRLDPHCQSLYGLTPTSTSASSQIAAIAYNVLRGNTGPGVITIAGCDYHDGTQATGDNKDKEIGEQIGRAVELAHRLSTPLFFAVISDGSCYSDRETRVWRGDAGPKGLAVMGAYLPNKAVPVRLLQLGHFTEGQGVNRSTFVGAEPKKVAYTILANYLSVSGRAEEFSKWIPNQEMNHSQIDSILCFA